MKTHYRNLRFWEKWFKPLCPSCKTRMKGPIDKFDMTYKCPKCKDVLINIDYH